MSSTFLLFFEYFVMLNSSVRGNGQAATFSCAISRKRSSSIEKDEQKEKDKEHFSDVHSAADGCVLEDMEEGEIDSRRPLLCRFKAASAFKGDVFEPLAVNGKFVSSGKCKKYEELASDDGFTAAPGHCVSENQERSRPGCRERPTPRNTKESSAVQYRSEPDISGLSTENRNHGERSAREGVKSKKEEKTLLKDDLPVNGASVLKDRHRVLPSCSRSCHRSARHSSRHDEKLERVKERERSAEGEVHALKRHRHRDVVLLGNRWREREAADSPRDRDRRNRLKEEHKSRRSVSAEEKGYCHVMDPRYNDDVHYCSTKRNRDEKQRRSREIIISPSSRSDHGQRHTSRRRRARDRSSSTCRRYREPRRPHSRSRPSEEVARRSERRRSDREAQRRRDADEEWSVDSRRTHRKRLHRVRSRSSRRDFVERRSRLSRRYDERSPKCGDEHSSGASDLVTKSQQTENGAHMKQRRHSTERRREFEQPLTKGDEGNNVELPKSNQFSDEQSNKLAYGSCSVIESDQEDKEETFEEEDEDAFLERRRRQRLQLLEKYKTQSSKKALDQSSLRDSASVLKPDASTVQQRLETLSEDSCCLQITLGTIIVMLGREKT